ncbi:hypothetical protein CHELA17_64060 [Chelatococcus asaccharovorans]|nr:hypothetical protein CHELA17_64060 [Chelatococcus asaccharovorans]
MMPPGLPIAQNHRSQFRRGEPLGDQPAQHTALPEHEIPPLIAAALAGDDHHDPLLLPLRPPHKADQGRMRFGLPHAVEIENGLDRFRPTSQRQTLAAFQRRKRGDFGSGGLLRRGFANTLLPPGFATKFISERLGRSPHVLRFVSGSIARSRCWLVRR